MKFATYILVFCLVGAIAILFGCANRGLGPTGGPKDVTPPRVLKSNPMNKSLNYDRKQVLIDFDEMISLVKPTENVVISPPQIKQPDIKAYGKRVTVSLNDPLQDSTTYSINFGNAIVDLNEGNPIKDYVFSFSTGNILDTLKISGTVIDAQNLNPRKNITVGIYSEDADSMFIKRPFLRIARTDENGRFTISNIKPGKYRIYALTDINYNFHFDTGEGLAFSDSLIKPTFRIQEMYDTIWKDSTHVDSIHTYMGTRYLPDSLALLYFKEKKKRHAYVKYERKTPYSFTLFFSSESKEFPNIQPLNFEWKGKFLFQPNPTNDTLKYWLTDSTLYKIDTLKIQLSYLKSDSAFHLNPNIDTLNIVFRKINTSIKKPKKVKIEPYHLTDNISPTFEVYSPITLKFEAPLDRVDLSKVTLSEKVDSLLKKVKYTWKAVDSTKTRYNIEYKWTPEKSYNLSIDSAAFRSIYDRVNNSSDNDFTIRALSEYSSVKIMIIPFVNKAIIQLLNAHDEVLAGKPANSKGTLFNYLKPDDYYFRMFIDENENGQWDTGELITKKQPEKVYYYNKKLTLKQNWDYEEVWNYMETPILYQKPTSLIKEASLKNNKEEKE